MLRPGPESEALLLGMWGKRLGQQSIFLTVKRHGRKLRLKLHPHLLRHYCATHLLQGGMGLEMVQQFLGHVYIDTTKNYVHVSYRELEKTFFRTHPRALLERAKA
jgi:integrase/recombinase XerD